MKNRNCFQFVAIVFLVATVLISQAPFIFSQNNNSTSHGFLQPSCPDFTRWVHQPVNYQFNDEDFHGFGLIPSPVDHVMMINKNGTHMSPAKSRVLEQFV